MADSCVAELRVAGVSQRVEYCWVGSQDPSAPTMVFLHEGLGSVSAWRRFPEQLCRAAGLRGLVYSRPGYGASTPRSETGRWTPDFLHRQAYDVLPTLLDEVGLTQDGPAPWILGHSDGGSIALIFAARFPARARGVVAMAPHLFVESLTLASIREGREAYLIGDLRARLSRHHADPDQMFWTWNDAWLDPAFADWNIEAEAAQVEAPILAIQGEDDPYGTMAQIDRLGARRVRRLKLPDCGHAAHRDAPEAVTAAILSFVRSPAG